MANMDGYKFRYLSPRIKPEPVELCHVQFHTPGEVTLRKSNIWSSPGVVPSLWSRVQLKTTGTARNVP